MIEHQVGFNPDCFTFSRRPVILKHYVTFQYIDDALYFEKKTKKYSRVKKEAFFKKDWQTMQMKAVCKNLSSHKNFDGIRRSSGDET
jgi:putative endonuclease